MSRWIDRLLGETQTRLLGLLRESPKTIAELAQGLALTDNAVRTHVAALSRDGLVEQRGSHRDTGGKPARVYGLTQDGEELFPKAYAAVLTALIDEIARTDGPARATALLQGVGQRIGSATAKPVDPNQRIAAAAAALGELGGDLRIYAEANTWRLQGCGCPLSRVSGARPESCELARSIIREVTGYTVSPCGGRGEQPSCDFTVTRDVEAAA